MKSYLPVLIALVAAVPAAAQTYKWVDERGVVTYGMKPPPGVKAERVDVERRNTIDTDDAQLKREQEAKRRADMAPPPPPPPPAPAAPVARGMDFDTYIRLTRGMTEGELVQRAGNPDYFSYGNAGAGPVKMFYWYPTKGDPYTTLVTVRGGYIDTIERIKKF